MIENGSRLRAMEYKRAVIMHLKVHIQHIYIAAPIGYGHLKQFPHLGTFQHIHCCFSHLFVAPLATGFKCLPFWLQRNLCSPFLASSTTLLCRSNLLYFAHLAVLYIPFFFFYSTFLHTRVRLTLSNRRLPDYSSYRL